MGLPETIKYPEAEERYQCSRCTLERAIKSGAIVAYKPGAAILIDKESADKWWLSTKIKPVVRKGRPRKGQRRD